MENVDGWVSGMLSYCATPLPALIFRLCCSSYVPREECELTVDPGLSRAFQISTYKVSEKNNYCRHWAAITPEPPKPSPTPTSSSSWFFGSKADPELSQPEVKSGATAGDADGLWIYCYPNSGINCYEPAWYSMRVIPLDKNKTRLEYEIFAKKGLEESQIQDFITFLKQVEKEVIFLKLPCPLLRLTDRITISAWHVKRISMRGCTLLARSNLTRRTGRCTINRLCGNKYWRILRWRRRRARLSTRRTQD